MIRMSVMSNPSRKHAGANEGASAMAGRLVQAVLATPAGASADGGLAALCAGLKGRDAAVWQACADVLVRTGRYPLAARLLERALQRHPGRVDLEMRQGEAWQLAGDGERASRVLEGLAQRHPADAAVAFSLAHVLREQGRYDAATRQVARCAQQAPADPVQVARCAQFAMQCQRDEVARTLCESALAAGSADPRLLALAGRAALVLGDFERARVRLLEALARGVNCNESYVALLLSMAQRYSDASHPDFALFERLLRDPALLPPARGATLLALGKACDDVGDPQAAVRALREGNALLRAARPWSRADWTRLVERQLNAAPPAARAAVDASFNPVFIVGMPRTGSTLIAERLGRDARVCNRDESGWLPHVAGLLDKEPTPSPERLDQLARLYRTHLRQDDAPAQWVVDKNPLNFRHLGTAAALFPNLRVIWCRRNPRDTALSIWSHFFGNPDNGYARDFDDIAAVTRDCERLMRHWSARHGLPVLTIDYEDTVAQPDAVLARVRAFVGMGEAATLDSDPGRRQSIVTASTWQARQPIYRHAVERWRHYADHLPELLDAFPDERCRQRDSALKASPTSQ
jgi:tetratricopeptide (TPR) repeat protein